MRWPAVLVVAVLLAGCTGSAPPTGPPLVVEGSPVPSPYDGPMSLPISDREDDPSVPARTGAAARALECDGRPFYGERGYFGPNLERVSDTPAEVLERHVGFPTPVTLPASGYRLERVDGGRALFSFDVGGRTKVAFVAVDGVRDAEGREGWAMEAWAQCDPAELPAEVTEQLGIGIWQDRAGHRVPVSLVQSAQGADHCGWQDITFLWHGSTTYLRDVHGTLRAYLHGAFERHAALPAEATRTGYRRDGRELWTVPSKEAAYLVGLDDRTDVERWPGARRPIGCA